MVSEEGDQETTRVPRKGNVTPRRTSPFTELLQGTAAAHDEIIPQQLQLLPAVQDPPHPLHVLVEALVDQPQVNQRLVLDLCEELQGLLAHLGHRQRGQVDTDHGAALELRGRLGVGISSPGMPRWTFRKQMLECFPAPCMDPAQDSPLVWSDPSCG